MIFRQASSGAPAPEGGRVAQKQRTRSELLRAARTLQSAGRVPTVADVADAAGISRTTAYRYFPTQEVLLAEATADPLIDAVRDAIASAEGEADIVKRVDAVFAALAPLMIRHEPELRTLAKIAFERSLEETHQRHLPLLSGRWINAWDGILEPVRRRLPPPRYAVMVRALGTLLSAESINVLRDACDFDDRAAAAAIRSSARAMVRGFLLDLQRRTADEVSDLPAVRKRPRRKN
jgi:AcrR family transcriptional regulator